MPITQEIKQQIRESIGPSWIFTKAEVAFIRTATLEEVEKLRGVSFTAEDMATGGLKVLTTRPSYLSEQ